MSIIEESIDVEVPIRTAYNQWTQFEEFPRFMEGVDEVEQIDDTTVRWVADFAGQRREWNARITVQEPDAGIAWESIEGARNAGAVSFEALSETRTRVHLRLEFDPEGFVEKAGDLLGFVHRRAQGDLQRYKDYIEARGAESGAWRGRVRSGRAE